MRTVQSLEWLVKGFYFLVCAAENLDGVYLPITDTQKTKFDAIYEEGRIMFRSTAPLHFTVMEDSEDFLFVLMIRDDVVFDFPRHSGSHIVKAGQLITLDTPLKISVS